MTPTEAALELLYAAKDPETAVELNKYTLIAALDPYKGDTSGCLRQLALILDDVCVGVARILDRLRVDGVDVDRLLRDCLSD